MYVCIFHKCLTIRLSSNFSEFLWTYQIIYSCKLFIPMPFFRLRWNFVELYARVWRFLWFPRNRHEKYRPLVKYPNYYLKLNNAFSIHVSIACYLFDAQYQSLECYFFTNCFRHLHKTVYLKIIKNVILQWALAIKSSTKLPMFSEKERFSRMKILMIVDGTVWG